MRGPVGGHEVRHLFATKIKQVVVIGGLTEGSGSPSSRPALPIFHFVNVAPVNPVLSSIGLILSVAGVTFLVWARQRLGRNWSQTVSVKEGHELVTSGPYRCIRHPMYTGGFIACLGSAIVAGGAFVFLLLFLGAIFLWRVGAEDKLMEQQFPNEYPDYKKRTKAVIPFVW